MSNDKKFIDDDIFNDFDNDEEANINEIFKDPKICDTLEIDDFPEPYKTIGYFMLSALSGATVAYIMNARNTSNDKVKKVTPNEYFDIYFKYCSGVKNDDYINEIAKKLKFDLSIDDDAHNFTTILSKLNESSKMLMDEIVENKYDTYKIKYINIPESDFLIEKVSDEIGKDLYLYVKLCKFREVFN
jgi:hypothetical protein